MLGADTTAVTADVVVVMVVVMLAVVTEGLEVPFSSPAWVLRVSKAGLVGLSHWVVLR